uniref:Aminotransferase class I/classII domain-containing protein n=1 Tax=Meloidogyne incognita TaxID=6306 RepID=A0A914N610_MELIC
MASDILSQVLFNSGDSVLTPAPYYYRFVNDFGERGLVNVEIVQTLTENGLFILSVERFEEAFLKAKGKVRAILIVNPQNPDGCYFTLNQLKPIIDWALNKNLFIILDEVYNLCIYEEEEINCCFESAVKLFKTPEELNKMIWVWSMSKVFSIPGLRGGVFYTRNKKIKEAVTKFMMFNQPNCVTQFIMRHFLDDQDWFEKVYLFENLRRLKNTRDKLILFFGKSKNSFY